MSFNTLRGQIKTLLDTLTELQEVKGYPTLKFNGYPSAYVVPNNSEADYETTKENIRIYGFTVRVFYETKSGGVESALNALEDLVDTVLDTFDQEDLKGSDTRTIGINLPSSYTYISVFAHPSEWGEVEEENLLTAEIEVRVRVSIDIS